MTERFEEKSRECKLGDENPEAMFARAFQLSPAALSISRMSDGQFLDVNAACCRLFEYERAEFIGHNATDLQLWHHDTDRDAFFKKFNEEGSVRDLEIIIQTRRGARLTVLFSAEPVQVGTEPCMIASIYDITSKRYVERLQKQAETKLRQMQKLEALGTLAGGIAHDFNNILTVIGAVTDLMELDIDSPETLLAHLEELRKAAGRARALVNQVLTFSRRQKQERQVLDLRVSIQDAVAMLGRTVPSNIDIRVELADEPILVYANPDQLNQVLMNLGTNGAQALGSNAGALTIELKKIFANTTSTRTLANLSHGWYASLTVKDEGVGMDEQTVRRVFEPFFTTKRPGQGTGLGLAVVHGIVLEHDGSIEVQSRPGEGTRIGIFLPIHDGQVPADAALAAEGVARGNGEHILFVDDDDSVGRTCAELLARIGYRVTVLTDPVSALARFAEEPDDFDMVITDLTMPKMTGEQVARSILERRAEIPVIIITGHAAGLTRQRVRELGIADLIEKPITLESLARTVQSCFRATGFDRL